MGKHRHRRHKAIVRHDWRALTHPRLSFPCDSASSLPSPSRVTLRAGAAQLGVVSNVPYAAFMALARDVVGQEELLQQTHDYLMDLLQSPSESSSSSSSTDGGNGHDDDNDGNDSPVSYPSNSGGTRLVRTELFPLCRRMPSVVVVVCRFWIGPAESTVAPTL